MAVPLCHRTDSKRGGGGRGGELCLGGLKRGFRNSSIGDNHTMFANNFKYVRQMQSIYGCGLQQLHDIIRKQDPDTTT